MSEELEKCAICQALLDAHAAVQDRTAVGQEGEAPCLAVGRDMNLIGHAVRQGVGQLLSDVDVGRRGAGVDR